MGSLLDSINDSASPDLIRSIASTNGQSLEGIKKGLEIAAATILGALAHKSIDSGFSNQVTSIVNSYGTGNASATTAADLETSSSLLDLLFGAGKTATEAKISQAAGLSSISGAALLSAAVPLVLDSLTNISSGGAAGFSGVLAAELPSVQHLIPAGVPEISMPTAGAARTAIRERDGSGWLWPVLLLGAVLISGLIWYSDRGPTDVATAVASVAIPTASSSGFTSTAWAKLGDRFERKLPDGVELSVPKLGVENKLIDWIESSNPVDNTTWFDFDRLLFATGSATLEPASQEQLSNVAAIMKAYANVKIKLGGYTDNTGDADTNLKLSGERAKSVMDALISLGVAPSRLEAAGYGEEHPVADNNTEDGRQLNRRISLRVTAK